MKDTIIKGTGNSRSLKTPTTLPATWEEARAQLIAGTFPVDIGPENPTGMQQQGTALTTANLLSAATAQALGLTNAATPNDALSKLKTLLDSKDTAISGKAQVEVKSYVGTGTYGVNNPCSLTFSFVPKVVFYIGRKSSTRWHPPIYDQDYSDRGYNICCPDMMPTTFTDYWGFGYLNNGQVMGKISADKKTISWYNTYSAEVQFNFKSETYVFVAID